MGRRQDAVATRQAQDDLGGAATISNPGFGGGASVFCRDPTAPDAPLVIDQRMYSVVIILRMLAPGAKRQTRGSKSTAQLRINRPANKTLGVGSQIAGQILDGPCANPQRHWIGV